MTDTPAQIIESLTTLLAGQADTSAETFLNQFVLNINYVFNQNRNFLGANLLVNADGPIVYVDTRNSRISVRTSNATSTAPYIDGIGLNEALEARWNA